MTPLLLIELNEVSFDLVRRYAARGRLPTFARLMAAHGVSRTTSEARYEELEPWIQWVSAHTGLSFAEHGVFRLGDIEGRELPQIWERLEAMGLKVGALSPMNASLKMRDPAFFLPDPWTAGEMDAPWLARQLYGAVRQAVNDNAEAKVTPDSALWLAAGLMRYAAPENYPRYLRLAAGAAGRPWRKAMVLDLLLADLFANLCRRTRTDFASLFLNAAAHIQHHYLHSSPLAGSGLGNPDWYCAPGEDPVGEVYEAYDRILAQLVRRFPDRRLMLATGLHQEPTEAPDFYWRLKDHAGFLARLGIEDARVDPRMSRDFLASFASEEAAAAAAAKLRVVRDPQGLALFEVDARGRELFVTLTYPKDIPRGFVCLAGNAPLEGLADEVAFVAIKNGLHDGVGYFLDTGLAAAEAEGEFPLTALPDRILAAVAA